MILVDIFLFYFIGIWRSLSLICVRIMPLLLILFYEKCQWTWKVRKAVVDRHPNSIAESKSNKPFFPYHHNSHSVNMIVGLYYLSCHHLLLCSGIQNIQILEKCSWSTLLLRTSSVADWLIVGISIFTIATKSDNLI